MKAVLGFLFILVGLTVGYLVLAGKLPNPSASTTSATPTASTSTAPSTLPQGLPSHVSGGPNSGMNSVGLPTMKSLNDVPASRGPS